MSFTNKRAIVFDLDGCLLDTSSGIRESVEYTLEHLNLPIPDEALISKFIGPPIQNSLQSYCQLSPRDAQIGAEIFRDYYKDKALLKAQIYEGIEELLENLRANGFKLAVATYKREDYALILLDAFNLLKYFHVIHGADNFNKKTKKDIILQCLVEMNCDIHDAIMVGDTNHDAVGACELGVDFIGVTWGFGFKEQDALAKLSSFCFAVKPNDILDSALLS